MSASHAQAIGMSFSLLATTARELGHLASFSHQNQAVGQSLLCLFHLQRYLPC